MSLSILQEETIAVLIGASSFPNDTKNLQPLPAVLNNIEALGRIFTNPALIGIPKKNILKLVDEPNIGMIGTEVAQKARSARDTLIVYYAGHGLIGEHSLYLATSGSTSQDFEYNSIPVETIKRAIIDSPAKKKIFILDCCFSGRALSVMSAMSNVVLSSIDINGTFAITATPANQPAQAPTGEKYTAFTGELIKVLETGIENGNEELTIQEIFEAIHRELGRQGLPLPQKVNSQNADRIILVRNQSFGESVQAKLDKIYDILTERLDRQEKRIEEIAKSISESRDKREAKLEAQFTKHMLSNPKVIEQGIRLLLTDTAESKHIWKVLSREFVSKKDMATEVAKWEQGLKNAESNLLVLGADLFILKPLVEEFKKTMAERAQELLKLRDS